MVFFIVHQDGMTVLHLAARFGHVDVLEVLRGKVPWSMASVKVSKILNLTQTHFLRKCLRNTRNGDRLPFGVYRDKNTS